MEEEAARGERTTCIFISDLLAISLYVTLLSFLFTSPFLSLSSELFARYKERMFIYSLPHYEHPNHHLYVHVDQCECCVQGLLNVT